MPERPTLGRRSRLGCQLDWGQRSGEEGLAWPEGMHAGLGGL